MDVFSQAAALLWAILWHGGGHLLAARLSGVTFHRVRPNATGFRLLSHRAFSCYRTEAICAAGGPLGNLLGAAVLASFARFVPENAAVPAFLTEAVGLSCFLGGLNLLPLPGFDGQRLGEAFLACRCRNPERGLFLLHAVGYGILALFWILSVYLLLRRGSALSLFLFCLRLFLQTESERTCPAGKNGFSVRQDSAV